MPACKMPVFLRNVALAGRFSDLLRPGVCHRDSPIMASPCMASPHCTSDNHNLPYANPDAPKGGRIVLALQGTFDSLNPLIVLGVAPDAVPRYVLQSLMIRSLDEPFSLYGLVARSVEMPEDRSFITFNLDPRARFSDGHPLTAEDVRFIVRGAEEGREAVSPQHVRPGPSGRDLEPASNPVRSLRQPRIGNCP